MLVWEAEAAATYGMFYTRHPIESPQEHLKSSANQFCQPSGLRGPREKESCRLSCLAGQDQAPASGGGRRHLESPWRS